MSHLPALPGKLLAMFALALTFSACGASTPVAPYDLLFSEVSTQGTTVGEDPAEIVSASIGGDILHIEVQFGGGCADHVFSLVRSEGVWLESNPVQTSVRLAHDANGDACRAVLRRQLAFDLTALKKAYQAAYSASGTIAIWLGPPHGGTASRIRLLYTF